MRRPAILVFLLTASLFTLQAQYALEVNTLVGFSGVFRAGKWTPIHVTVQNLGEPVRGELELEFSRGDRFGPDRFITRYARPIELVSGASKAFSFVVPLDTTVYPLMVRIRDEGRIAHEEQLELLGRSVPSRLALVLARRPNLDFLLPLYNSADTRLLDIVYPLPDYLPGDWHGYQAIDTLIMHDVRLQDISRTQVIAIRNWIASGGRLVISGGAHFGPADAQTLEPLGTFATDGIATTTVGEAGFLEMGLPVDPSERGARVVATRFAEYGTRIARLPIGRGDVIVLPVDYANLVRVAPLTSVALWNALLAGGSREELVATGLRRRVFEVGTLANQLTLPLYDFPSRLLILGLAVSYAVGLGGVLVWLSRGRDRVRRWLGPTAIVAIVVAVTLTGHSVLTVSLQPVEALALTVERAELMNDTGGAPEDGYALITRDTAIFSRRLADYDLRYAAGPLLVPLEERDHRVRTEFDESVQRVTVDRWGYENSFAVRIAPFELGTRVTSGSGYIDVELSNRSAQRINGLVLLRNGLPEAIGDLHPGETIEHVANEPEDREFQGIRWDEYVADGDLAANRARLLGDIAREQRFEPDRSSDLIVVGWTEAPLLPVVAEPAFEQTVNLHVLTIPISLARGEP